MACGPAARRNGPFLLALTFALLLVAFLLDALAAPPVHAQTPQCENVVAVPRAECEALVALYENTDGANWLNNSGWLQGPICSWFGVSCAGGHVTAINLPTNGLRGNLPRAFGVFAQLTRLNLRDNGLRGPAPATLCELLDTLTTTDLAYNQLEAPNRRIRQCLDLLQPDWATTQTSPVRDLRVTEIFTDGVTLVWRPISYTADSGAYEISYGLTPAGVYTVAGVTAGKAITTFTLSGLPPGTTHFLRVRSFTPAHADMQNDQLSLPTQVPIVTRADGDPVLLLIYFPADNDLSPYAPSILERVRRGTLLNPNLQALFLIDRLGPDNTRLFEIAGGTVVTTTTVLDVWGKNELDTTDPAVLSWFLTYGRARFPATKTVASLMGHGMGLMPEFGWIVGRDATGNPIVRPGIPALPRGIEATPGDIADAGGYLSTIDFGQALAAATQNGADPFDLLFFDQCFQGNFDVLYETRAYADVVIASPNYAWLAAPYHQYGAAFAPAATPEQMAQAVVRLYEAALTNAHPNAIFWLRNADLDPIAKGVNQLAQALLAAVAGGRRDDIFKAAQLAQYVDTTQCGRAQFNLAPPDELLGAGSLARNLRTAFGPGDAFGVTAAANNLISALGAVTTLHRSGNPYIAPTETWDYVDALTLLAPLDPAAPADVVWRASIYTTTGDVTAVWSPLPTQTVAISTTFASVTDNLWDDFIAGWYTEPLTPTLGEWCLYTPPALVTGEADETLALAVDPTPANVILSWTPTSAGDAAAYWILARARNDVNWVLLDTVPIDQTEYTTLLPDAGATTLYQVVAQDVQGVTLAESNAASYTASTPLQQLFVPLLPNQP
jgi:hypothetical protein